MQPMLRPTMILATIIYIIALIPATIFAPFVIFLFDEGTTDIFTYCFAIIWFSLPITLLTCILGSWFSYIRNKNKATALFLLAPIAHAVLIVIIGILHFARY